MQLSSVFVGELRKDPACVFAFLIFRESRAERQVVPLMSPLRINLAILRFQIAEMKERLA